MHAHCDSHMRTQLLCLALNTEKLSSFNSQRLNFDVGIFVASNSIFIVHTSETTQFVAF